MNNVVHLREIDGKARSLHALAGELTQGHVTKDVHIRDVPGTQALRALIPEHGGLSLGTVVERGPRVASVECAPLDRLIGSDEILPVERAFRKVLGSGQFTTGPFVDAFEREFGAFLDVRHVVGSSSGTDALIGGLMALGAGPGTEVIIPPNSFPGTENAVHMTGATPVLADVTDEYLLDPESVAERITARTRCVVPVHLYGHSADVRRIAEVCAPHGVAVFEDAAQGVGLDEVGRFSAGAAFSFNPYKNLGACGKAGAFVTDDADLADRVKQYLYHGFTPTGSGYRKYYKSGSFGLNARIDNLQAAALQARMQFLALNNLRRAVLARRYIDAFAPLHRSGILRVPEFTPDHVWHLFTIDDVSDHRDDLIRGLHVRGVQADVYYPVLTHRQSTELARTRFGTTDVPVAEALAGRTLQLPLYPRMTTSEQDVVIDAVFDAVGARATA